MSGTLRLRGSTSGYSELQAPAVAADQTFILPTTGGTLLTTDSPISKLTLELGSASQPSLTFEGDTDTGLYSSGTNTLNLVTGGSNRLDIDSSGKVRIGTNTSRAHLTVAKGGSSIPAAGADTASAIFGNDADAAVYGLIAGANASGTGYLQAQRTDGNTTVYPLAIQPNGGNVGIGITNPTVKVQADGSGVEIRASDNSSSKNVSLYGGTSSNDPAITFTNALRFYSNSASSERMRIDSSGRVGIGAISFNDSREMLLIEAPTGQLGTFVTIKSPDNAGESALFFGDSDFNEGGISYNHNGDIMSFRVNDEERIRIDSSGNLNFSQEASSNYPEQKLKWSNDNTTTNGFYISQDSDRNGRVWHEQGLDILFGTSNTEQMRIDSSGRLLLNGGTDVRIELGTTGTTGTNDRNHIRGDGSSLKYNTCSGGLHVFEQNGTERMRIDSSGRLLVGHSSNLQNQSLQVVTSSGGCAGLYKFGNNDDGSELTFFTSRNATKGSHTVVQNGDYLGRLFFRGSDGSGYERGAEIAVRVDGTPGTNDMPGRIEFYTTADGSTTPTERMRLNSSGQLLVNTTTNTNNNTMVVNGRTKTSWFTCDTKSLSVGAGGTATLTIHGFNPTFVQVYIKVNFGVNGGLQAHFDYELLTCDSTNAGGGTAIRQSLNESVGSFQVSTSDFAVTRSNSNIIITYTNQVVGSNMIDFYVNGLFNKLEAV